MDQLPRLGKRELFCLLLFTCNYVVSVLKGFLFLWVLGMGYVILLWHSLSLSINYFSNDVASLKEENININFTIEEEFRSVFQNNYKINIISRQCAIPESYQESRIMTKPAFAYAKTNARR